MPVPAVLALDVDHGELAGHEVHAPTDGSQRDLDQALIDLADGVDVVVVQGEEEAGQKFAVDVEGDADATDREVGPSQDRGLGEG
jgi:hypothetical protein